MFKASNKVYISKRIINQFKGSQEQSEDLQSLEKGIQQNKEQFEEEKKGFEVSTNYSSDYQYDSDDLGEDFTKNGQQIQSVGSVVKKDLNLQSQQQMQQTFALSTEGIKSTAQEHQAIHIDEKTSNQQFDQKVNQSSQDTIMSEGSITRTKNAIDINATARFGQIEQKPKKYKQQVDTNVFHITMECLKNQLDQEGQSPYFCKECEAILNKHSKVTKTLDNYEWNCEFCDHKNVIESTNLPQEPSTEEVDYLIKGATNIDHQKKIDLSQQQSAEDISIVYCIDISGSMNDSTQNMGVGSNIRVTRLHCVKETIKAQIKEMNEKYPERRVGLVTFDDTINIIGDSTTQQTNIKAPSTNDYDEMVREANCSTQTPLKQIKETYSMLNDKVSQLSTGGCTALGPAILSSIIMAGKGQLGSQVIICTDGLSNQGLGSLSNGTLGSPEYEKATQFYKKCGEMAQQMGITVHIVTIIGQECNIDAISAVSDMTGGFIERVDPIDILKNFKDFISKPILGTRVQLTLKLHKAFEFRGVILETLSRNNGTLIKQFGNVNEETDFTFEYRAKDVRKLINDLNFNLSSLHQVPFQAQIQYTTLNGDQYLKVITNMLEISSDKQEVIENADIGILSLNAIQQTSKVAKQGNFKKAQVSAKAYHQYLLENVKDDQQRDGVQHFQEQIKPLYEMAKAEEKSAKTAGQFRTQTMKDVSSSQCYQMSRVSKKAYTESLSMRNQY